MEKKTGYVHGYNAEEQDRLYQQARFLQRMVYEDIDLSEQRRCIEVGCGVGAQTEILLETFPQLEIHGLDASEAQLKRAAGRLKNAIAEKKVFLSQGDAAKLPHPDNSFDSAFVCWLLEHVNQPLQILKEIRRVLQPNGVIYCTEVLNATLYLHPYSPATLQYWFAFNDHQWNLGGDPFVGAKLGNYLYQAGFQEVTTQTKTNHFDNRMPKMRTQMFDYWTNLLLSGTPELLAAQKVSPELVEGMKQELQLLKQAEDSIFFYSCIQARAKAF